MVTERDKGKSVPLHEHPLPSSNYLAAISHRYSRPATRARFFPPAVFTLGTWFPYLTLVHIRIIQGGFLKIDEKAGAPRKTRLYPDLASGIHGAPSRRGKWWGWISSWRDPTGQREGEGGKKDKSGKRVLAANLPRLEYIATGMAERNIVPRTETAALKAPSRREVWLNYRKATKCQH